MVLDKIRDILSAQFDVEADTIDENTRIADDLGADSLDAIDMVMSIEDEFGFEVPDEDVEHIHTVGELVAYVEDHM